MECGRLAQGDYKQADYGKVILPLTVLRRLDCVLEPTKQAVLDYIPEAKSMGIDNIEVMLNQKSGYNFNNTSPFTFKSLKADPANIAENLKNYIDGFSSAGREIMDYFKIYEHIIVLGDSGLLFKVVEKFVEVDLHPDRVSNDMMGYVFEEWKKSGTGNRNNTSGREKIMESKPGNR
ncbi:MAG: hypothetical protein GY940_14360 [bacterium]|nr:hypothetical protein [bacterium]